MFKRFFTGLYYGVVSYYHALVFIFRKNLWPYYIVPVVLSAGMYLAGMYLFEDYIRSFNFESILKADYDSLKNSEELFSMLILGIELIVLYITVNYWRYIVIIILTPALTLLSAKTESRLTGKKYPLTLKYYIQDIIRAWKLVARNMVIWMLLTAACYFVFYLIDLAIDYEYSRMIRDAIILVIGFYFYGFSLMDYTNERRRMSTDESIRYVRKNTGLALAIGAVYGSVFLVPYVGLYIGVLFSPVTGVVAATLAIIRTENKALQQNQSVDKEE